MLSFFLLSSVDLIAQRHLTNKIDTLQFKSIGTPVDTFYLTRERINGNIYKQVTYYGLSDHSNLTTVTDFFVIDTLSWKKLYKNDTIPFLSVRDFEAKKKTYEYIDTVNKEQLYYEYEPVKKISIKKRCFYLYRVRPMSGRGMVEGLGDDIRYIVFDFTIGEVFRSSYHIKKVMVGYEKLVPYFKW